MDMIGDLLFLQEVFLMVSPILYYRMGIHYFSSTFPKKSTEFSNVNVGGAHDQFPLLMTSSRIFVRIDQNVSPFSNPRCNEIFSPPLMTLFVVCDGKGIQKKWKCVYTDIYEKIMIDKKVEYVLLTALL